MGNENILSIKGSFSKEKIDQIRVPYRLFTNHWFTIIRPQYGRTCGISSVVSVWNYQFSTAGKGKKDPLTV